MFSDVWTVRGFVRTLHVARFFLWFVGALLYLISPWDLLPESVFGLAGLLDDTFFVGVLFLIGTTLYYNAQVQR